MLIQLPAPWGDWCATCSLGPSAAGEPLWQPGWQLCKDHLKKDAYFQSRWLLWLSEIGVSAGLLGWGGMCECQCACVRKTHRDAFCSGLVLCYLLPVCLSFCWFLIGPCHNRTDLTDLDSLTDLSSKVDLMGYPSGLFILLSKASSWKVSNVQNK